MIKNLKIGTRITLGFGAVILVTIALSLFAYVQLTSINANTQAFTDDSFPGVYFISQMKINVLQRYIALQELLGATDPADVVRLEADGLRLQTTISGIAASYEKTIHLEKHRQLFGAMDAARQPYLDGIREVIQLAKSPQNRHKAQEVLEKQVKPSYVRFSDTLDALVTFNKEEGDKASASIFGAVSRTRNGVLTGTLLALLIACTTTISVTRSIIKPLAAAVSHLERVSRGDFSQDLASEYLDRQDEIGTQARAMQAMSLSLRTMIREVTGGIRTLAESSTRLLGDSSEMTTGSKDASVKAQMVAAAAEQMSSNVAMVAHSMGETSNNLANVATSTQQMTGTIGEIALNSERARGITADATRQAAQITEQMNQLGQAAREIGKVTEAITEISSQTNLLALNATIEAARAGSAGKGFAVVANEIKALAQQTAVATEDIKARITGVQSSTALGVAEIEKVSRVIHQVSDIVSTIAGAIEEQATATKDIARNIAEASSGVQEVNTRVAESSQVSVAIATDIVVVHQAADKIAGSSRSISNSATELTDVAEKLKIAVASFQV